MAFGPPVANAGATNTSAGRFPDGVDTGSNCADFLVQAAAALLTPSAAGDTNIKVAGVEGFDAGEKIMIDAGADRETAVIAEVGTAGATTLSAGTDVGATVIPVAGANLNPFTSGAAMGGCDRLLCAGLSPSTQEAVGKGRVQQVFGCGYINR